MGDKIVQIDSREQYMQDMQRYSLYILMYRYTPSIQDGLKPVQRRILTAMYRDVGAINHTVKSSRISGSVIGKYHPHGDASVYAAMKPMVNWFESSIPLLTNQGNFGTFQGEPAAASRYTEAKISNFALDCVLGDLLESKQVVDWIPNYDNTDVEPEVLPVKVPLLLINGAFSISVGVKVDIPHYALNDLIDATLELIHNPKAKISLIPDQCMPCEIVDNNWQAISNKGYGHYVVRGIVKIIHNKKTGLDELSIQSVPDMVFSDTVIKRVEELITSNKLIQVHDIIDLSTNEQLDVRIVLKKGSDPEYVKQVLYKNTSLQTTKRVNIEVLDGVEVKRVSCKAYLLYFIEFRRMIKFRLYNFRLQNAKTKLHQIDAFIKILESGDVEGIIHAIRNNATTDENALVQWLMKKLKITDLQAKFIIHTQIGKLSKGNLNKYKEEFARLTQESQLYTNMILNQNLIDDEIIAELKDIRKKYNYPRKSIIIKESDANNIPEGEFKIVVTEANYIKKMQINDPVKVIKGDKPKAVLTVDNSKDIVIFDEMGKVFRLPVSKIMFTDKNSVGIDVRLLVKNLTSNIVSVMYLPALEMLANKKVKYYLISLTKDSLIKRMDLQDITMSTPSGIIYSKLNKGDAIKDVTIASANLDIIVFSYSKALRMPIEDIPYLKRSTLGNKAMSTTEDMDGLSIVTIDTTDIVVVTYKGKVNRFNISGLPRSNRAKAGSKVIKLTKGDFIVNILSCNANDIVRVTDADAITEVKVSDITPASSISPGVKMFKDGIIKAELIKGHR